MNNILLVTIVIVFIFIINNIGNIFKNSITQSKFGDLLGEDGIIVLETKERNMLDFSFRYSLPSLPKLPQGVSTSFYKWPLLYLIDPSQSNITLNSIITEYSEYYLKPPPKALLNIDYVSYGPTGEEYYSPNNIPFGKYFPNIINLTNLYSNSVSLNLKPHPVYPFKVDNNTIKEKSSGGWIIQGLSSIINTSLVPGREYILGISLQLINKYINVQGTTKFIGVKPIEYRYGNFNYVKIIYSLTGLNVITPDGTTATDTTFSLTV
jgi:hypothetical protein